MAADAAGARIVLPDSRVVVICNHFLRNGTIDLPTIVLQQAFPAHAPPGVCHHVRIVDAAAFLITDPWIDNKVASPKIPFLAALDFGVFQSQFQSFTGLYIADEPTVRVTAVVLVGHSLDPLAEIIGILHRSSDAIEFRKLGGVAGESGDGRFTPDKATGGDKKIRSAVNETRCALHQDPMSARWCNIEHQSECVAIHKSIPGVVSQHDFAVLRYAFSGCDECAAVMVPEQPPTWWLAFDHRPPAPHHLDICVPCERLRKRQRDAGFGAPLRYTFYFSDDLVIEEVGIHLHRLVGEIVKLFPGAELSNESSHLENFANFCGHQVAVLESTLLRRSFDVEIEPAISAVR